MTYHLESSECGSQVVLYVLKNLFRFQDGVINCIAETLLAEKVLKLVIVRISDDVLELVLLSPHFQLCEELRADTLYKEDDQIVLLRFSGIVGQP